jgi:hypothetical protein
MNVLVRLQLKNVAEMTPKHHVRSSVEHHRKVWRVLDLQNITTCPKDLTHLNIPTLLPQNSTQLQISECSCFNQAISNERILFMYFKMAKCHRLIG